MLAFRDRDIPFMEHRGWVLGFSLILVGISLFLLFTLGLNYGTDFKGGLKLVYQFDNPTTEVQVTEALSENNLPPHVVQRFGPEKDNSFVIKSELPEGPAGVQEGFSKKFTQLLGAKYPPEQMKLIKEEFVGPKVGKELRTKGIYAVIWAVAIMLIYIGFRFDFYFAPGAIVALIHDVVLTLGVFALVQREVNLTVVAAFLTIVGYSVNDTIIVFDRIRENIQKMKGMPLIKIINKSISQILMRTIITSLTLFFVVVVLFFRAEGDIKNFAFAMIIGVIVGTYSSVFIATPVFYFLREHGHRFGLKKPRRVMAK